MQSVFFVHSLFRSGSTYLFEVFRRSPNNMICFQEAFHEIVLDYFDNPSGLIVDRNRAHDHIYRHPDLTVPYYAELVRCWPAWKNCLQEADIFEHYFCSQGSTYVHGFRYWESIISSTDRNVLFQETRTTGKQASIKKSFPGSIGIYLWRNPWDQWYSYKVTPYFDAANLAIIHSASAPAACRRLLSQISHTQMNNGRSIKESIRYYQENPLLSNDSYKVFFLIWMLGLIEGLTSSDLAINIDLLSVSPSYREELHLKLSQYGLSGCDFSECKCIGSFYTTEEKRWFHRLEDEVLQVLCEGGYPRSELNDILALRDSMIPESLFNRGGSRANALDTIDYLARSTSKLRAIVHVKNDACSSMAHAILNQGMDGLISKSGHNQSTSETREARTAFEALIQVSDKIRRLRSLTMD